MTDQIEIYIAYDLWHVEEAISYSARGTTIVCLDFWVERELEKKNIPCISLRDVIDGETGAEKWWLLAQDVAREWYRLPSMKFFEYRGIRIAEAIEPILETYLSRLFYYVRIYMALKKIYPDVHFSIPAIIVEDRPTDECLVSFEQRIVTDAARIVGLHFDTLGRPVASRASSFFQTIWKSLLIRIYNRIISFVPRLPAQEGRNLKIYAGEYWSHIAPVIEKMEDVEVVLMESGALKQISWRQLLKHRILLRHPSDEIHDEERKRAIRISSEFAKPWEMAKEEVVKYLAGARGELDWSPILEVFEYLVAYAPRVIADIDAIRRIIEEEKPDVLLQSSSVSSRHHHFFTMARVAAQLGVPSVELQHGVAYLDPRSIYSRIETDYLASYGTDVNKWHELLGTERSKLVPVGSPRFDRCINSRSQLLEKGKRIFQQLGIDTKRPVLLVTVPKFNASVFRLDSYQFSEFFKAIHAVQSKIPGLQMLFKCRNQSYVNMFEKYFKKLFPRDSFAVGNDDLFALMLASDAVVCGNSTVLYEAVLAKKPLILYPWRSLDIYNARIYEQLIPIVRKQEELVDAFVNLFSDESYRKELLRRQEHFIGEYSFDGRSSERVIKLIEKLSYKRKNNMIRPLGA